MKTRVVTGKAKVKGIKVTKSGCKVDMTGLKFSEKDQATLLQMVTDEDEVEVTITAMQGELNPPAEEGDE